MSFSAIDFLNRAGVSPAGLVIGLFPVNSTVQDLIDSSGKRNHFQQTVVGNQVDLLSSVGTSFKAWDFDGSDFVPQIEIDDETGITAHQLATVATGARYLATGLDMSQYATESGNRQYRAVFHSAAGTAWAYAGGADSAEALGADLLSGWDFTVGWTQTAYATLADANSYSSTVGGAGAVRLALLEANKVYKVTISASSTTTFQVCTINNAKTTIGTTIISGNGSGYFTGVAGYLNLYLRNVGIGTTDVSILTIQEVTSFGTTGVKLYNSVSGATQSLVGNSSLAPNAITAIEIYKVIGSSNLTGDFAFFGAFKPDDGRPASAEKLFSKSTGAAGTKGIEIILNTDGTVQISTTEDGTNLETVTTDAAVFSDGAQTGFTSIGFVVDKTSGTGSVIVNGASVAVTETITTGAIYDTYSPVIIGATGGAGYFNGQMTPCLCFERALSAAEIQRIDLQLREEGFRS